MTRLERRLGQTLQILMLIAVSCLHCQDATICMNFQLTIMQTTNSHNTLSTQSDQPHCCLLLKYLLSLPFYKLFCQFWFSGRCVSLHSGNIHNQNIWNANSNGSGQTCAVQSRQDICRSLKLKICPKNLMASQKIIS